MPKQSILVLSPHLDDAVLSCGDHIRKWKKSGLDVTVISIFTEFNSKYFGSEVKLPNYSQEYMNKSGFSNLQLFRHHRHLEDKQAMQELGVKFEHWKFIDGGFRENKGSFLYPTAQKLFSGHIHPLDESLIREMTLRFRSVFEKYQQVLIPYGVGNHVDHHITRLSAEIAGSTHLFYYVDMPYALNWRNFSLKTILEQIHNVSAIRFTSFFKRKLLAAYSSQIKILLPGWYLFPEIV